MRQAFSLIELTLCVALVGIFAGLSMVYLGREPEKALVTRAKHELHSLQKQVQARVLKAPNYHFDTLEQALGRREPLLDPWNHPYILMHGTFNYEYRPEIDYWVNGTTDALYSDSTNGESGEQMLDHWIISAGPNKAYLNGESVGPGGAKLDDLKVKVRLGMPKRKQAQGYQNEPLTCTVSSVNVMISLWDHASPDGDYVEVRVNGSMQVPKTLLTLPPKHFPLTLNVGPNVVEVYAHNEGTGSPNTVTHVLEPVTSGSSTKRWGLRTNHSGFIHVTATP